MSAQRQLLRFVDPMTTMVTNWGYGREGRWVGRRETVAKELVVVAEK